STRQTFLAALFLTQAPRPIGSFWENHSLVSLDAIPMIKHQNATANSAVSTIRKISSYENIDLAFYNSQSKAFSNLRL
ncbi:hypothetical protein NE645_17715, partial [Roseburia hominis]|nr:hypothetical protein [Roseburia hominis]